MQNLKVTHPNAKTFQVTQTFLYTLKSKQCAISYSNQVVNQNKQIKVDKPVKQTNHHQQTKQINQLKQVNPDYHSSSKLPQF